MTAFLVLAFAYTLSQFYRAFLAIVAGDLGRDLGLSPADLGLVSAVWFATFAASQFPVGYALDRFGPRRTISGFMIAAVAGAAWMPMARGLGDACAAMGLIGLGCSPLLMGSLYVFARSYPLDRFAMLSSLMVGIGACGDLIGSAPLALAAEAFGWRATLVFMAAVTASSGVLIAVLLRDPPRAPGARNEGLGAIWTGLTEIVRMRALWPVLPLVFVSYAVLIATRSLWIAPFLEEVHGFGRLARGNAAMILSATMVGGALGYGPIERLVGDPKRTALCGCAATGIAFLALGFLGSASASLAVALLAVIGLLGMNYAILMAHGRRFFPPRLLGRGVTFLNFIFMGGAGAIQAASGALVRSGEAAGVDPAAMFGRLFSGFGLVLLAATAVYALAPAAPGPAEVSAPPARAP